ncbi:hypothetical protein B0T14DRAFT_515672 [Immersiella caudata]|uniref:Uncharacterized protein n=1 Tax=Immersiella caudata TaxID=314043 RepID=A0AA39WX74_9PEZI|nr:hypothetical protein B0T14DRAFT_515672 [Immersiella caudata]
MYSPRRALGRLDPNTSSPKSHQSPEQQLKVVPQPEFSISQQILPPSGRITKAPRLASPATVTEGDRKREGSIMASRAEDEPAPKRPCLGDVVEDRQRSMSPDASSVFDNSAIDTSQLTTVTEPDVEATGPVPSLGDRERPIPVPPRPQPSRSPEEIKKGADILRVRLGLARYKVKTGQPDKTLDQLEAQAYSRQAGQSHFRDCISQFSWNLERSVAAVRASAEAKVRRPLPLARREMPPPVTRQVNLQEEPKEEDEVMGDPENDADALPKLRRDIVPPTTPRRKRSEDEERRLSSSALQNGAASGLLSLSRS